MQPCTCSHPCAVAMSGTAPVGCRASWPYALAEPLESEAPETRPGRTLFNRITGFLALAFLAVAVLISWPQSLGGPFRMVVVTGISMEPWLHTGDLVLAMKRSSYQPGDAIVYTAHEDGQPLGRVVHRVITVNPDGTYVTQGDNKDYRDPWNIEQEWINGEVVLMAPKAYLILSVWRHPIFLAVMSGLFLTMALWPRDPLADPPAGDPFVLPAPDPKPTKWQRLRTGARQ